MTCAPRGPINNIPGMLTLDNAQSDGRHSSWNLQPFVLKNWCRTCSPYTNQWNPIQFLAKSGYLISELSFFPGISCDKNSDSAGRHCPSANCRTGAQGEALVWRLCVRVFNNPLLASRKICDLSPDNNLSDKTKWQKGVTQCPVWRSEGPINSKLIYENAWADTHDDVIKWTPFPR